MKISNFYFLVCKCGVAVAWAHSWRNKKEHFETNKSRTFFLIPRLFKEKKCLLHPFNNEYCYWNTPLSLLIWFAILTSLVSTHYVLTPGLHFSFPWVISFSHKMIEINCWEIWKSIFHDNELLHSESIAASPDLAIVLLYKIKNSE